MTNNSLSLMPAGNSKTSPKENKQGKVCYAHVFRLTDLPDIMDQKGWPVSSAIMRKWFANPAYKMSQLTKEGKTDAREYPPKLVDTSTVKMNWVLSFPRAKKEYDKIFGTRSFFSSTPPIYESEAARNELVRKLAKSGKFSDRQAVFGNLQDPVQEINQNSQFQYQQIGNTLFNVTSYGKAATKDVFLGDLDLDDLWGALGDFLLKIAGEGEVIPETSMVKKRTQSGANMVRYYDVQVNKIGVYVRDTYDFNGTQYLGHWRKNAGPHVRLYALGASRGDCPNDFVKINNEHFVMHREQSSKGGDLLIFSDVLVTTLSKPFKFRVTSQEVQSIIKAHK